MIDSIRTFADELNLRGTRTVVSRLSVELFHLNSASEHHSDLRSNNGNSFTCLCAVRSNRMPECSSAFTVVFQWLMCASVRHADIPLRRRHRHDYLAEAVEPSEGARPQTLNQHLNQRQRPSSQRLVLV